MATGWFFSRDGQTMHGPCSSKQLKRLATTGQLLPSDRVRRVGAEKTIVAGRVKGLFATPAEQ